MSRAGNVPVRRGGIARASGLVLALAVIASSSVGCSDDEAKNDRTSAASTGTTGSASATSGEGGSVGGAGSGGDAAASTGGSGGAAPIDYCSACGRPTTAGTIDDTSLDEASGLAASAVHAGVVYAQEDSGNPPRIFAFRTDATLPSVYDVAPVTAIDWEDMARGPCGAESCLFLGDIGDNQESRSSYAVYRVLEPASIDPAGGEATAEALPFVYPDGSHNAETLLVDPVSGIPMIVTKVASGASSIFAFPTPLTPGQEVTLVEIGQVEPPTGGSEFTGGDVHPQGQGVLLRTYSRVLYYAIAPGQSIADALAQPPCELPVASELQGESVAWTADGDGYLTLGEKSQDLHAVVCAR